MIFDNNFLLKDFSVNISWLCSSETVGECFIRFRVSFILGCQDY